MPSEIERSPHWNLLTAEDTYASATAQNPATSRRVKALIPTEAGLLERQRPKVPLLTGTLNGSVGFIAQFDRANGDGTFTSYFFAASSTKLYVNSAGSWSEVTAVGALHGYPQAVTINNLFHLSDGTTSWIFDGTNWVSDGLPLPLTAPAPFPFNNGGGLLDILSNRYYWFTWGDSGQGIAEREHQSSNSPRSAGTGPLTKGTVRVYPFQGAISAVAGSKEVTGAGSGIVKTATGKLTLFNNFVDGDVVSLQFQVYTARTALSGAANEFLIDSNPQISLTNLQSAVNGTTGAGTAYGTGTVKNPYIGCAETATFADASSPTGFTYTATFFALMPGSGGNKLATTATIAGGGAFEGTTLAGGISSGAGGNFDTSFTGMKLYINGSDFGVLADARLIAATGTLKIFANPVDGDKVTLDGIAYTFKNGVAAPYDVKIDASGLLTLANLRAAINDWAGEGSIFGTGTIAHPTIRCQDVQTNADLTSVTGVDITATFFALSQGSQGNALATTATLTDGGSFLHATLTGGHSAQLATAAASSITAGNYTVGPVRADKIHIYASESEESNFGLLLTTIPVSQPYFDDNVPFNSDPASTFSNVVRPRRNDPPPASKILTLHQQRIFRARIDKPQFFTFSAQEEVTSLRNGSPEESNPGADANTVSDLVDGSGLPTESREIRAICSHGDAAYFGATKEILPLYGTTFNEFGFSNVTVFKLGVAGRYAMASTHWGLAFVSYDRRVYLYPSGSAPAPNDVTATSNLVHLSRPLQNKLKLMDPNDLDNVHLIHYLWSTRDWLVLTFKDKDTTGTTGARHIWVYDFAIRGWFELDTETLGIQAVAVLEPTPGTRVLVGGGTDGVVYVLDDLMNTYNTDGLGRVDGIFRPALIDFGNPEMAHLPSVLEFEVTDPNLADTITVSYWLDPVDADNPPEADRLNLEISAVETSAYRFRGFFNEDAKGCLCFRLLVEVKIGSSALDAKMFNLILRAEPVLSTAVK